jgi:hypothetical protein
MEKYEFREWNEIYAEEGLAILAIFQKCLIGLYQSFLTDKDISSFDDFVENFFKKDARIRKREFFTIANIVINGTIEGMRDKEIILGIMKDKTTGVKIKPSNAQPEEFKIALLHIVDKMEEFNRLRNFMLV